MIRAAVDRAADEGPRRRPATSDDDTVDSNGANADTSAGRQSGLTRPRVTSGF